MLTLPGPGRLRIEGGGESAWRPLPGAPCFCSAPPPRCSVARPSLLDALGWSSGSGCSAPPPGAPWRAPLPARRAWLLVGVEWVCTLQIGRGGGRLLSAPEGPGHRRGWGQGQARGRGRGLKSERGLREDRVSFLGLEIRLMRVKMEQ